MMRGHALRNGRGCAFRRRMRQIAEAHDADHALVLVDDGQPANRLDCMTFAT